MEQLQQNKNLIVRYFNAVSNVIKTRILLEEYVTDEELIAHILFFDTVFPRYEVFADEMTAEDNRVVVLARLKGVHEGEFNGILPTHRTIEFPFIIIYKIEDGKISHHSLMADQMILMEQLDRVNVPA